MASCRLRNLTFSIAGVVLASCTPQTPPQPGFEAGVVTAAASGSNDLDRLVSAFVRQGYRVARTVPGSSVQLLPAAGTGARLYASVEVREIPDPNTALLSLEKGDLDAVYAFPQTDLARARREGMEPRFDRARRRWCAFANDAYASGRTCPPAASLHVSGVETPTP